MWLVTLAHPVLTLYSWIIWHITHRPYLCLLRGRLLSLTFSSFLLCFWWLLSWQASCERFRPQCRQRHLSGYWSRIRTRTLTLTRTLKIKKNKKRHRNKFQRRVIYKTYFPKGREWVYKRPISGTGSFSYWTESCGRRSSISWPTAILWVLARWNSCFVSFKYLWLNSFWDMPYQHNSISDRATVNRIYIRALDISKTSLFSVQSISTLLINTAETLALICIYIIYIPSVIYLIALYRTFKKTYTT